jgi:hypothetical protein
MHFGRYTRCRNLRDHSVITVLPGLTGGRFDTYISSDAAEDDRPDRSSSELDIQIGPVEGRPTDAW